MQQCVLASGNQGKLKELAAALSNANLQLVSQAEFNMAEAEETAVTFVENALIKARHASLNTGLPSLADDSGLVVNTLNGAPGVYSARYAANKGSQKPTDKENIQKLLQELDNRDDRSAYFVCVLAMVKHADDPEPLITTGRWHGEILQSPSGNHGFGYDPVFYCPETKMSAAEMGSERKGMISHRAKAVSALLHSLTPARA